MVKLQYNLCYSENIAALIRNLFHGDWILKYSERKCVSKLDDCKF